MILKVYIKQTQNKQKHKQKQKQKQKRTIKLMTFARISSVSNSTSRKKPCATFSNAVTGHE
mgnify:CR=1 FL=1